MKHLKNIKPYEPVNMTGFVKHKSNGISSKAIIDNDDIEIRLFSIAAGEAIDKETFSSETVFMCLEGKIVVEYDKVDSIPLEAGQMTALEAGTDYGVTALEASKYCCILINGKTK